MGWIIASTSAHSNNVGFIDDTYSKLSNVSGQLNYRVTDNFKVWGAAEYKQDKDRFYWGTPLVPANAPGIVPTSGIVSGLWSNYYLNGHTGPLNPVTIDARTLKTNYNVLDNHSGAKELWLRSGFQWDITNNISLKSQVYGYDAHRQLVQQRDQFVRQIPVRTMSIANVLRSIMPRDFTATSPT